MPTTQETNISAEQIDQLIRTRRSVFADQFEKGSTIPEDTIWRLLENANWAPNHKGTEPWRFVVFSGGGLQKFAEFQASRYKETSGERFQQGKYEKLLSSPLACSHIVAIIMKRSRTIAIPEIEEVAAVACAVENIYLSLAPHGIGGYWSTGGTTFDPAAHGFLGMEEGDVLMGYFYLGFVKFASTGGRRGDIREKTTWING